MKKEEFSKPTGKVVKIQDAPSEQFAFIPDFLPPKITIPSSIIKEIHQVERDVARFDGMMTSLQDPMILTQPLKYQEVQTSSDLEGTTVDLVNIVAYEIDPKEPKSIKDPRNDAREVANLKMAINHWIECKDNLPLSMRLIKELHQILMSGVRGGGRNPGEFRKLQNQIGTGRFIPPPANELLELLNNLEKWINDPEPFHHPLLKSIIAHYQFEAIHPFMDGNGRVGRFILSIMVAQESGMNNPPLYMSAFFNEHRSQYYDFLYNVSTKSDWLNWIDFCLTGIGIQAKDGMIKYMKLQILQRDYLQKISKKDKSGRLRVIIDNIFTTPVVTVNEVMKKLEINWQTARNTIKQLEEFDILRGEYLEGDPKQYFIASDIVDIIYSR